MIFLSSCSSCLVIDIIINFRVYIFSLKWKKHEFIVYFLAAVAVVLSMACYQKFKVKICQMETGRKWSREREREKKKSKITIFHEVAAKKM